MRRQEVVLLEYVPAPLRKTPVKRGDESGAGDDLVEVRMQGVVSGYVVQLQPLEVPFNDVLRLRIQKHAGLVGVLSSTS